MSTLASYQRVCGIDVSQQTLDLQLILDGQELSYRVSYDEQGLARIVELCRQHQVQIVVLEATGGLQRPLALALVQAQIPLAIVNPCRIRYFARAQGILAKTDKVDARVIALFALKLAPKPSRLRDQQQEALARLVARKTQLLKLQTAELNRQHREADALVLKSHERLLELLKQEIAQIDEHLEQLVQADALLQCKAQILQEQKGVGRASAVGLVAAMPELGTLSGKQAAALGGLAPYNQDSGKTTGERHIFGGRASVRTTLYMCTLSAVRYDPKFKSFYQRLLAAGKCKMKALTACMRKLLVVLNARVRDGLAAMQPPTQAKAAAGSAAGG